MPLIIGAKSATATGYAVDNSCRFNEADSAHLSRSASGGSRTTWTISVWVKRSNLGGQACLFNGYIDDQNETQLLFNTDDIEFYDWTSSSRTGTLLTDRKFKDPMSWYHIVAVWDTTNATAGNRMRLYVNGVEETSFATDTQPSLNQDSSLGNGSYTQQLGLYSSNSDYYFDGYLAEAVFCDGQAYAASDFGEFDEDSPTIWKPKDFSGDVTFGTNGFYLDFKDSADLGADVSGNGNDFTATNLDATDQATDSPTNNFCTLNPLSLESTGTLSEGNCDIVTGSSQRGIWNGTFGLTKGKWYFEMKVIVEANEWEGIGISDTPSYDTTEYLGISANQWGYYGHDASSEDGKIVNDGASTEAGEGFHADDIVGCYMDLDNNKLYWAVNGVIILSGVGVAITAPASVLNGHYFPSVGEWSGSTSGQMALNFGGCAAFTVSSANQDANGYGNFEYDPSSGTFDSASKDFLAICSKNLGSDG